MKKLDSFEAGLVQERSYMLAFARRLFRDAHAAEDAVQEAYVRALTARHTFVEGTNLRGWLGTIVLNVFRYRVRGSNRIQFTGDANYADHVPAVGDPEQTLIHRETLGEINRLQPEWRDTLWLKGVGCSLDEIAYEHAVPVGTVKSRGSRAREALREMTGAI